MVVPTEDGSSAETPVQPEPGPPEVSNEVDMDQDNDAPDAEMHFVGNISPSQGIGSLEPSFDDEIAEMLLAEMGSSGRVRHKDGRKAVKKMVSEIYSPPRVTELLRRT